MRRCLWVLLLAESVTHAFIMSNECTKVTPGDEGVYWAKGAIRNGGTLSDMAAQFYMCDEWKFADVIQFYKKCKASMTTDIIGAGKTLADLTNVESIKAGEMIVFPIPVRGCPMGSGQQPTLGPFSKDSRCVVQVPQDACASGGLRFANGKCTSRPECYGGQCRCVTAALDHRLIGSCSSAGLSQTAGPLGADFPRHRPPPGVQHSAALLPLPHSGWRSTGFPSECGYPLCRDPLIYGAYGNGIVFVVSCRFPSFSSSSSCCPPPDRPPPV